MTDPVDPAPHRRQGGVAWLTGLSASGKSSLARAVESRLVERAVPVYVLDGDVLRRGLNKDLGFSQADREENIRRVGEVARLFAEEGHLVLVAVIAPYRRSRALVRGLFQAGRFLEVWCKCPLEVCERRDPKGLYRRARAGELPGFTGVTDPYEDPVEPELVVETDRHSVEECADRLVAALAARGLLAR